MWLLCHGQQTGAMQDQEQARVYSFDGQHFQGPLGLRAALAAAGI